MLIRGDVAEALQPTRPISLRRGCARPSLVKPAMPSAWHLGRGLVRCPFHKQIERCAARFSDNPGGDVVFPVPDSFQTATGKTTNLQSIRAERRNAAMVLSHIGRLIAGDGCLM